MKYVARKRCTFPDTVTIFDNRIVPGQVHLALHLRPLCPGVSPTRLNPGERRRSGSQGHVLAIAASLAVGVPVDLGAAVGGLDERNLALVATAIWTAGGHARGSVSW